MLGFLETAALVGVILLFIANRGLRARLVILEQRQTEQALNLARLENRLTALAPHSSAAAGAPADLQEPNAAPAPPLAEFDLPEDALPEKPVFHPLPAEDVSGALPQTPASPPRAAGPIILTPERLGQFTAFLQKNWVYVVSAVSLALAAVFTVQYGIENGYLTPVMRVLGAIALGAGLIAWGERLRRRQDAAVTDHESSTAGYLAATFSGAGLVAIFVAILAARQLYGLIGPAPTLAGLVATAALAVVLGWFNGSFLVGVGLLGAAAAPFLTGGGGQAPAWFYAYFALIAGMGLAIDTLRRWAWVSVLALVLGYAGGAAARTFGAGVEGWSLLLLVMPVLATILPERALVPRQDGPPFALALRQRILPPFPVRLAGGSLLVSTLLLAALAGGTAAGSTLALIALTALGLGFLLWASAARGLEDLGVLPALGILAVIGVEAGQAGGLWQAFQAQAIGLRPPESPAPLTVSWIMLMLAAMAIAGTARALQPGPLARAQGLGAAVFAGAGAALLHLGWNPAPVMGAFGWAAEVMGLAAVALGMAVAFDRRDGADRHRTATAALLALSLAALSIAVMTSGTPLTLALCILIVVAAALDRRFDLPEMSLFLQAGAAVLTYRMLVDPGMFWADRAPMADFLAAFLGPILAGVAALRALTGRARPGARAVLESATALWIVGFADASVVRWVDTTGQWVPDHMAASLFALPWLGNTLAQVYRAGRQAPLRRLRQVLAAVSAVLGLGGMAMAAVTLNPLTSGRVIGPPVVDSLAVAYLVPGAMLLAAAWAMPGPGPSLRRFGLGLGAALVALYLGLEIRRFWWGDDIGADLGVMQAELYTYTLALMLGGAGLLFAALARHSTLIRRIAMTEIALTIAKVFLIDAAGLTGLTRVFSFLGLGLSLAGLAWLNGWVERASRSAATGAPADPADPPAAP